jgi:hypothetical protein
LTEFFVIEAAGIAPGKRAAAERVNEALKRGGGGRWGTAVAGPEGGQSGSIRSAEQRIDMNPALKFFRAELLLWGEPHFAPMSALNLETPALKNGRKVDPCAGTMRDQMRGEKISDQDV